MKKQHNWGEFDKYFYYRAAVQSPDRDVAFIFDTYKELNGREPTFLREDFCGAFALCCEWVKYRPNLLAMGVDIDAEPLAYGTKHYLAELSATEQARLQTVCSDVKGVNEPRADMICALNFSYFIFKQRQQLREYFAASLKHLNEGGILLLDCFGGSKCYEANEEEIEYDEEGFSYFWDQESFNPINHEAKFKIHFQRLGEAKRMDVFSYDWRLWTLPELRELLVEAGFRSTHVYWEGSTEDGEGNGEFTRTEDGEDCEAWVAYIAALK